MNPALQFITYCAWLLLCFGVIRICALIFVRPDDHQAQMIRIAEAYGKNPVGSAIFNTAILIALSACWLLAHYTT